MTISTPCTIAEFLTCAGEFAADNAAGAGVDLGAYAWDPASEPRDPWPVAAAGGAAPAPPLNADSPEAVSAIQDQLAATPGVLTFKGARGFLGSVPRLPARLRLGRSVVPPYWDFRKRAGSQL
mgnify:CR=1 FL=1